MLSRFALHHAGLEIDVFSKQSRRFFGLWLLGRAKQHVVTGQKVLRLHSQLPAARCSAVFQDLPAQVRCNCPRRMPSSGPRNYLLRNSS